MPVVTNLSLFKALGLPENLYPLLGKPTELRVHLATLSGPELFELFYYKRDIFPSTDFAAIEAELAEKTVSLSLDQCWSCFLQSGENSALRNSARADIRIAIMSMPQIPFVNSPFGEILRTDDSLAIAIAQQVIQRITRIAEDIEKLFSLDALSGAARQRIFVALPAGKKNKKASPQSKPQTAFDTLCEMITAETLPILARLPLDDLFRAFCQTTGLVKKLATTELEKRLRDEPPFSCYSRQFLYDHRHELNLDYIFAPHLSDLSPAHISDLWTIVPESQDRLSNEFARQLAAITWQKIAQFSIDELINISCQKSAREELGTLPADTLRKKLEAGPALIHAQYFRRIIGNLQTDSQRRAAVKKLLTHLSKDSSVTQEEMDAELNSLASHDDRARKIFAAMVMP